MPLPRLNRSHYSEETSGTSTEAQAQGSGRTRSLDNTAKSIQAEIRMLETGTRTSHWRSHFEAE